MKRIRFEEWKNINGNPDYKISNLGRVKSFRRSIFKGLILRPIGTLYPVVKLPTGAFNVHALVMEHFGPLKPTPNHEINHKDHNKWNAAIYNLEWVTHKENIRQALNLGLRNGAFGERHPRSKLKEQDILKIRELCATEKYQNKEIANIFGVDPSRISRIKNFKEWKTVQ